ncbi:MAG: Gfo/Idh/MocA family oxidoreductase [Oceanospirillaceae bacterium]|nr:Gfo/Idh/MocA family oxidoreductase [Oceanospirillaceae bacterium]
MKNTQPIVRLAIIGTGSMGGMHAKSYTAIENATLVAAVDTNETQLIEFCNKHDIEHRFTSLQALLDWNEFDAVSNVTPDQVHHRTSLQVIAANKHILCEKPLAVNYQDAREMADAAAGAGVINMVNLSYRNVASIQKAAQMVADGCIGQIKHFEASYLQSWLTQPAWGDWKSQSQWLWRLSSEHGSKGVLGDVGIHIIDFVTFVANQMPKSLSCQLHTFNKAEDDKIGEYPLDANDSFVMHMQLDNDALGVVSATRFASGHHNDLRLRIYGDKGGLEVSFENSTSRLRACLEKDLESATWHEVECADVDTIYQKFIDAILLNEQALPNFERGAQLQQLLDTAMGEHK